METGRSETIRLRAGHGICTDMRAVRKDYFLDHGDSAYVDQWDWERVITAEQRNLEFLKSIIRRIWKVIVGPEQFALGMFLQIKRSPLSQPSARPDLSARGRNS
jgi:aspartate--ammonia ligase